LPAIIPFALILLGIALLPLAIPHRWEKNSFKGFFVAVITAPTAAYLLLKDASLLVHAATEYLSFIVLLASLFMVAGGIVLRGDLRGTPWVNAGLLFFGSVLANLVGTTGASMLLIRPMLRANRGRKYTLHIPVFFIFMVSNSGGLLTPLGDPPLFLGFLRGVRSLGR
jgi:Na+/H+ antiporter NhaD/arsenite permease-like protein